MQALVTDGEDELLKACKSVFKESIALRCFRHFQQNVETALKNYGMQDHMNAINDQILVMRRLTAFSKRNLKKSLTRHCKITSRPGKNCQEERGFASISVIGQQ